MRQLLLLSQIFLFSETQYVSLNGRYLRSNEKGNYQKARLER